MTGLLGQSWLRCRRTVEQPNDFRLRDVPAVGSRRSALVRLVHRLDTDPDLPELEKAIGQTLAWKLDGPIFRSVAPLSPRDTGPIAVVVAAALR
jgi:hypothetical protein